MTVPAANRSAQWFYDTVGGANMGPVEKVVWHTTEGFGWPGYDGGRKAPHYTVLPDYGSERMVWRAHFPDTVNARAMRNDAGGVQTNLDGALQVEIVGTCDQTPAAPKWTKNARVLKSWALTDWQIAGLAQFVAWANLKHRVPLAAPALWLAYGADPRAPGRVPASYGASPARMTGRTWDAFRGHCGHQHAPENDHGDPGRLPIGEVFARAADLIAPQEDDDMELGDTVTGLGAGNKDLLNQPDGTVNVGQLLVTSAAQTVLTARKLDDLIKAQKETNDLLRQLVEPPPAP